MTRSVVIGVTAHNEGRNLGRLLERLRATRLSRAELRRIVVVVSGCTDDTPQIARRAATTDDRIRVIVDPERRGKAVAIDQLLAEARDADVVVMESADTLPEPDAIDALVRRFDDPTIGMVGGHPVPDGDTSTFLGYVGDLLWRLHHAVASVSPKQGELVAWRNVVESIPEDVSVDEAYLEAAITREGYRLAYAPEAVVRNRGPASVGAFIAQRRRIHAGHRVLASRYGYRPATRDHRRIALLGLLELVRAPLRAHWTLAAAALEAWSAILGLWDHAVAHRSGAIWPMIDGTKSLLPDAAGATPPVAAIVVTHAGRSNVVECVAALARNAYPALRVIVVDNGADGGGEAVRAAHPDVRILRTPNDGLAAAFNAGLAAALSGDPTYVLQVNDDVVVANDFLSRVVSAAEERPRAGAVGGPVYRYDDPERIWFAGGGIVWPLGKTYHRGREVIDGPRFQQPRRVDYVCGAAVLYRAEALREVGAWDDGYFLVFEDSDWSVRASRAGWQQWYVPGPQAWHKISQSFGGEKSALYLYFLFRNNLRFMRRHARPWHWPTFVAFYVLESLCRYSLTGLLTPGRWARLRAIWLGALDGIRGRTGAGAYAEALRAGTLPEAVAPSA